MTAADGRRFAFTVAAGFAAFAAVAWWRDRELPTRIYGTLAVALLLAGALVPSRLTPVQNAWMRLGHAISRVTTPIVMSIIYFVVITPIGLLRRLIGRPTLVHPARGSSAWVRRPPEAQRSNLHRQF